MKAHNIHSPKTYTNDPLFHPQSPYLSDQALTEVLDGRPIVCLDILFVDEVNQRLWLPMRVSKPAEGLWFVGGMVKRGETFELAAVRIIDGDTGLNIKAERLTFLGVNRFVWNYRQKEPSENGRVDINFCYTISLSADEAAFISARLNSNEYNQTKGLQAYGREELEQALVAENPCKLVLLDYYDQLFAD